MELSSFYKIPKLNLIADPTPVHRLKGFMHTRLWIKREDMTDPVYGGNKVRNLEFLLAEAVHRNAKKIVTMAPLGSNFIAALAVQTEKLGIPTDVFHFQPATSALIRTQAEFSAAHGAQLYFHSGGRYLGAVKAKSASLRETITDLSSYTIAPGGSSPLGTLGHIRAIFELHKQICDGEIPEPDLIVVGAGTCGTMAGLLAGVRLTGMKTHVIGVRCVDAIVCNAIQICRLGNAALRLLHSRDRIFLRDVDLRNFGPLRYGDPMNGAAELIDEVKQIAGIDLDTTYTSKVFSYLKKEISHQSFRERNVLYWHTFSSGAISSSAGIDRSVNISSCSK